MDSVLPAVSSSHTTGSGAVSRMPAVITARTTTGSSVVSPLPAVATSHTGLNKVRHTTNPDINRSINCRDEKAALTAHDNICAPKVSARQKYFICTRPCADVGHVSRCPVNLHTWAGGPAGGEISFPVCPVWHPSCMHQRH